MVTQWFLLVSGPLGNPLESMNFYVFCIFFFMIGVLETGSYWAVAELPQD
jgi:hypothetical protein